MKALVVTLAIVGLGVVAQAAPVKKKAAPVSTPSAQTQKASYPASQDMLKGASLFAHYSLADSMDVELSNGNVTATGDYTADAAFGIGGEYEVYRGASNLGFVAGGLYEFARTVSKTNLKVSNQQQAIRGTPNPKPTLAMWEFYGNADFPLTQMFSAYGGVNYNFPVLRKIAGAKLKGRIGWQVGGSVAINDNMAIDGMYRAINMGGTLGEDSLDSLSLDGFLLRGRYMF